MCDLRLRAVGQWDCHPRLAPSDDGVGPMCDVLLAVCDVVHALWDHVGVGKEDVCNPQPQLPDFLGFEEEHHGCLDLIAGPEVSLRAHLVP